MNTAGDIDDRGGFPLVLAAVAGLTIALSSLPVWAANFGLTASDVSPLPPLAGTVVPEAGGCVLLSICCAITAFAGRATNSSIAVRKRNGV